MITRTVRRTAIATMITLAAFTAAALAEPSNQWRIELDHYADNDGEIVLRISPVGGTPIEVEVIIPAGTGEYHAADILSDALMAALGKGYEIEVDDGEVVLIKKRGNTQQFDLKLVSSSVTGLTIELEHE
jgi:hypothetical protein